MTKKLGFSFGYSVQIDKFEPFKFGAWAEEEVVDGEHEDDAAVRLAKKVMSTLETLSVECALKAQELKAKMIEEFSEEENDY